MSQDPRYLAESHQGYPELMEYRSPEARGAKRDHAPLPEAARQVIREQLRGGPAAEAAAVRHTRKRAARKEHPPPSPAAAGHAGHAGHQAALPAAPGHASAATSRPKVPTCQEMYNTWRALGEQINNIARLPAFIKSSRLLCHRCRILKLQCNCYDYSQLESVYRDEDHRLRQVALRQIPASDALLRPGASAAPAVQYPSSITAAHGGDGGAGDGEAASVGSWPARRRRQQPSTPSPLRRPSASAAPAAPASAFSLAAAPTPTPPPPPPPPPVQLLRPPQAAQPPAQPPRLVQFEIREVVFARERIGTHTRLWCCQYSTASPPAESASSSPPASPRVHLCTREDENLVTIRRHYSREHGSHRYHSQPALRMYCSGCGYVVRDGAKDPPSPCPGCGAADGRLWLRMLYALVEVPVPLQLPESSMDATETEAIRAADVDTSADVEADVGGGTDAGVAMAAGDPYAVSAPPVMPLLPQLPTPISPGTAFSYWMAYAMPPAVAYPLGPGGGPGGGGGGGGGLLMDTGTNGGSLVPQTPLTPGFPPGPTTVAAAATTTNAPALYPPLAETDVFSDAWGQALAVAAQQQQQQPEMFLNTGVYYQ